MVSRPREEGELGRRTGECWGVRAGEEGAEEEEEDDDIMEEEDDASTLIGPFRLSLLLDVAVFSCSALLLVIILHCIIIINITYEWKARSSNRASLC